MRLIDLIVKLNRLEIKIIAKVFGILSLCFLIYLLIDIVYLRQSYLSTVKENLKVNSSKIITDFKFIDNKWDTSLYVSDETISLDNPLYIFTSQGYLIDRRNPITGYLDTSDLQYALTFQKPQTITTPINEVWRVLSIPVIRDEKTEGAILVAFYFPEAFSQVTDDKLLTAAKLIDSKLMMKNGLLDATLLKSRDVGFDINYEVIDRYNRALISVGGPPSAIDPSKIQNILNNQNNVIIDTKSGERFLVYSRQILDSYNEVVGVVSVGKSLKQFDDIIRFQIRISLIIGVIVLALCLFTTYFILGEDIKNVVSQKLSAALNPRPKEIMSIRFDKERSIIVLDSDTEISIPDGSIQYGLCKLLFETPKKSWQNDELFDKLELSIEEQDWHSIYDAHRELNRRARSVIGMDFIEYSSGKYSINPKLLPKIQ